MSQKPLSSVGAAFKLFQMGAQFYRVRISLSTICKQSYDLDELPPRQLLREDGSKGHKFSPKVRLSITKMSVYQ